MSSIGMPAPAGAVPAIGHRAFTPLWTATLMSNTATLMHAAGADLLMTTLSPGPAVVTQVQAPTTLPVFCFELLAGVLADRFDTRGC